MSCRMRTSRAVLSPSMKTGRPLIISIAAARSEKWKKPSLAGCAARSPGSNSNLRRRRARCRKNATNSPKGPSGLSAGRPHIRQDQRDILDDLKIGLASVQNPSAEQLPDEKQAGRRVLIVDHDENALIALKRLLGEASYHTTTARGGLRAL